MEVGTEYKSLEERKGVNVLNDHYSAAFVVLPSATTTASLEARSCSRCRFCCLRSATKQTVHAAVVQ